MPGPLTSCLELANHRACKSGWECQSAMPCDLKLAVASWAAVSCVPSSCDARRMPDPNRTKITMTPGWRHTCNPSIWQGDPRRLAAN